ncbi:hypothetical protein [Tolypothrix sp. VBCCA 56010]|uniref:hypothetical protein n=1 Tax=Tolypothrix sp. VBCCA 56010 TaxID=3137731 RepID=UPI003D7CDFD5
MKNKRLGAIAFYPRNISLVSFRRLSLVGIVPDFLCFGTEELIYPVLSPLQIYLIGNKPQKSRRQTIFPHLVVLFLLQDIQRRKNLVRKSWN